jgi:hypothetical protein
MKTRAEIERRIPASGAAFDVVVAGGGPAGIGAAVAAAKTGASTLLLEARAFFGGVASLALWMNVNRLLLDGGSRGGVHDMFVRRIRGLGPEASVPGKTNIIDGDGLDIHPEYLRAAAFELLEEAGCAYQLYSPVTGVLKERDTVRGVVVAGKEGRLEYHAAVTVDATGDGDVAHLAGVETRMGGPNGELMPVSLVFAVANVDVDRFIEFVTSRRSDWLALIERAREDGLATSSWYAFDRTTLPGTVSVNNGGPYGVGVIDATRSGQLTVAERAAIEVALDFVKIGRRYAVPGLERCVLARAGAAVAVRETRRIVGEYVLTLEDVGRSQDFPDTVARRYGKIDAVNLPDREALVSKMRSGYGYPYRSMLPAKVDNLLVAGRCGSATQEGMAAGRAMGNMMELGQAAGVAAALAVRKGARPRDLDAREIQERLAAMGVKLFA